MPATILVATNKETLSFIYPRLSNIRVYDSRATPLPIIINLANFEDTVLTTFSFIINPVNGGSPPPLTKDRLKFLELVCINLTSGAKTTKYIRINHHIRPPETEKIQPIWTIPEKITTKIGIDIELIVIAPNQMFIRVRISLEIIINNMSENGAIFCHVWMAYTPNLFSRVTTIGTQKWRGMAPILSRTPKSKNS